MTFRPKIHRPRPDYISNSTHGEINETYTNVLILSGCLLVALCNGLWRVGGLLQSQLLPSQISNSSQDLPAWPGLAPPIGSLLRTSLRVPRPCGS